MAAERTVSVVIPARDEAASIGPLVEAVLAQDAGGARIDLLVVDDGSRDETAEAARRAGARLLVLERRADGGNPAVARNRGVAESAGDPVVFIDADCFPVDGWLRRLLAAHDAGATVVGGSLALPDGLPLSARCDYYCGWYHVHDRQAARDVPNHPPGNLSVRRAAFESTAGFTERMPIAYAHEELEWQAELGRSGHRIRFEPAAVVLHYNRPGFGNLLRRNYRWGYCSIETKATTGAARLPWLYRRPWLLILGSLPFAGATTVYVVGCWLRARVYEPVWLVPAVLAARLAYSAGMVAGGVRWLRGGGAGAAPHRPRWE